MNNNFIITNTTNSKLDTKLNRYFFRLSQSFIDVARTDMYYSEVGWSDRIYYFKEITSLGDIFLHLEIQRVSGGYSFYLYITKISEVSYERTLFHHKLKYKDGYYTCPIKTTSKELSLLLNKLCYLEILK